MLDHKIPKKYLFVIHYLFICHSKAIFKIYGTPKKVYTLNYIYCTIYYLIFNTIFVCLQYFGLQIIFCVYKYTKMHCILLI